MDSKKKKQKQIRNEKSDSIEKPTRERSERVTKLTNKKETDKVIEKPQLVDVSSTWTNYQGPVVTKVKEEEKGPSDFELLLHAPKSTGGHFQFKSEKQWEKNQHKLPDTSDIFNFDLNFITAAISCIPFYQRVDINIEKLSQDDLRKCDVNTKIYQEQFKNLESSLKTKQINLKERQADNKKESKKKLAMGETMQIPKLEEDLPTELVKNKLKNLEDAIEETKFDQQDTVIPQSESVLTNICLPTVGSSLKNIQSRKDTEVKEEKQDEDLEDWLDNILDD